MNNHLTKLMALTLLFCGVNSVFSQEWDWQHTLEFGSTTITEYYSPADFIELPDGNFISPSYYLIRGTTEEYYSEAAAAMMFSENGDLITQNNFFRPGYCTSASEQFIFKKDNSFYFLTTYSPEHTIIPLIISRIMIIRLLTLNWRCLN